MQDAGDLGDLTKPSASTAEVRMGCRVVVRDELGEDEYTIVRAGEADATRGRISAESPVGRALLGHRSGDRIEVRTPGGCRALTVLDVTTPEARSGHATTGRMVP